MMEEVRKRKKRSDRTDKRKDFSPHYSCRLADFCRYTPRKSAHGEGAPNPSFIQSTGGLR